MLVSAGPCPASRCHRRPHHRKQGEEPYVWKPPSASPVIVAEWRWSCPSFLWRPIARGDRPEPRCRGSDKLGLQAISKPGSSTRSRSPAGGRLCDARQRTRHARSASGNCLCRRSTAPLPAMAVALAGRCRPPVWARPVCGRAGGHSPPAVRSVAHRPRPPLVLLLIAFC
jgi:hypothetical protein